MEEPNAPDRSGRTRNPLRRTSDRIQALAAYLAVMVVLLVAPWAAWSLGRNTYREQLRASEWERQRVSRAEAVLGEDAVWHAADGSEGLPPPKYVPTAARWTGPDGLPHTGTVFAAVGGRKNDIVLIWVDPRGAVASPPAARNPAADAVVVALFVSCGIAGALTGLYRIVVWRLDRGRLRAWQQEWVEVEPRWTRQ